MTDTVIRAESLGKRYTLGRASSGKYRTLRESLTEAVQAPWRRWRGGMESTESTGDGEFWALRDVSFEIKRGEVVGIIGRNGAGKSTLLKVLSRITEPTTGRIALKGRVASLLEVGTGFHPELTGRENIYLNGAILGMHRAEIKAKFDEIVAFAEVERFLDTPVKRYSSGMYVRLAFAVAAHLEPEILVVDEVLAVGDSQFQKKCLGKMQDVSQREGRTIIFVSHQLSIIEHLCTRGIVLRLGQVVFNGSVLDATRTYLNLQGNASGEDQSLENRRDRRGEGAIRITQVNFLNAAGNSIEQAASGEPLRIRIRYKKRSGPGKLRGARFSIAMMVRGSNLFICSTELVTEQELIIDCDGSIECLIDRLPLSTGTYQVGIYAESSGQTQDWVEDAAELRVEGGAFYRFGRQSVVGHEGLSVLVEHSWQLPS